MIASSENRQQVPLTQISAWLPKATIAIEDRRFYEHHGVDWKAVARAAVKNLKAGKVEEGGSTLTQQLVRNIFPQITREVTAKRKLNEALVAQELEKKYSKQWILEQYLNTVPYGHFAVRRGGRRADLLQPQGGRPHDSAGRAAGRTPAGTEPVRPVRRPEGGP